MKPRMRASWLLLLVLLPLTACSASPNAGHLDGGTGSEFSTDDIQTLPEFTEEGVDNGNVLDAPDSQIIEQAWLDLEVRDIEPAVQRVADIVQDLDGRVDERSLSHGETPEESFASLRLRVPAARLSEAIEQISASGKVLNETTGAHDVTLQHVDLSARVDALSGSISRLEALLDDASSVADLVEVETALADRQAELDSLRAQLDVLTDQVEYATLFVELRTSGSPISGPHTTFWEALVTGFWSILTALKAIFIAFGYALPWLGVIALIVLAIWGTIRIRRRRNSRP